MKEAFTLRCKNMLEATGDYAAFFASFFRNIFSGGFEWNEFIKQCYLIGLKSLNIVLITGFILGFVLTLQSQPTLKAFGAEGYVPNMVSISIIREIGPVIISLICAGKIASGIGAELGKYPGNHEILNRIGAGYIHCRNLFGYFHTAKFSTDTGSNLSGTDQ